MSIYICHSNYNIIILQKFKHNHTLKILQTMGEL